MDLQELESRELTPTTVVIRDALVVRDRYRTQAVDYRSLITVGDVFRTNEGRLPCRRGRRVNLSWRVQDGGKVKNAYMLCQGWQCPRCAPVQLEKRLLQIVRAWESELDRMERVVLGATGWPTTRRARRIKEAYPKRFLRVLLATGEHVIYTPGPVEGSTRLNVDELGRAITEDMFKASIAGDRRFTWPARTAKGGSAIEKPDEEEAEREKARRVCLPKGVHPEDVNKRVEEEVGRKLEWEKQGQGAVNFKSWVTKELGSDVVDRLRENVFEPLGERRAQERQEAREVDKWMKAWSERTA
jgi:hypothetical protein